MLKIVEEKVEEINKALIKELEGEADADNVLKTITNDTQKLLQEYVRLHWDHADGYKGKRKKEVRKIFESNLLGCLGWGVVKYEDEERLKAEDVKFALKHGDTLLVSLEALEKDIERRKRYTDWEGKKLYHFIDGAVFLKGGIKAHRDSEICFEEEDFKKLLDSFFG